MKIVCTLVIVVQLVMDIYSISDGRKKLGDLVHQVRFQQKVIGLGHNGKAEVLLVSFDSQVDEEPITEVNAASESFTFLADEPDIYTVDDVQERYV